MLSLEYPVNLTIIFFLKLIVQITALPDPYTSCEEDGETTYFDHFTGSGCRIECETDLILEACGCKLAEQPGDADVCGPAETHECAHPELGL